MKRKLTRIQIITLLVTISPVIYFLINFVKGEYFPYPTLFLIQFSGNMAILFLVLSLSCSPLQNTFGLGAMLRARKIFGLSSFYYALLHAFAFIGLDYQFNIGWLLPEFTSKPYLLLGLAALILLIILAFTSIKRFQIRYSLFWKKLHKIVYAIALLVGIHQYLAIKGDKLNAVAYLIVFSMLMILRIPAIKSKIVLKNCSGCRKINQWLIT